MILCTHTTSCSFTSSNAARRSSVSTVIGDVRRYRGSTSWRNRPITPAGPEGLTAMKEMTWNSCSVRASSVCVRDRANNH